MSCPRFTTFVLWLTGHDFQMANVKQAILRKAEGAPTVARTGLQILRCPFFGVVLTVLMPGFQVNTTLSTVAPALTLALVIALTGYVCKTKCLVRRSTASGGRGALSGLAAPSFAPPTSLSLPSMWFSLFSALSFAGHCISAVPLQPLCHCALHSCRARTTISPNTNIEC